LPPCPRTNPSPGERSPRGFATARPACAGLRYPVEFLLELLSSGMTTAQGLADYPDLESDDLLAVSAYAARLSRVQRIEPLAV